MRDDRKVISLAASPEGQILALLGSDGVRLIAAKDQTPLARSLKLEGNFPLCLAFRPGSSTLAVAGAKTLILWDYEKDHRQDVPAPRDGSVTAVAFSPDGTLLGRIAGSKVEMLDVAKLQAIDLPAELTKLSAQCLAFSLAGKVAVGDKSGSVSFWTPGEPRPLGPVPAHAGAVLSLAFNPDNTLLVSGGNDNALYLWDVKQPDRPLAGLTLHKGPVQAVAFSPDGSMLASAGGDQAVILWDVRSRLPLGPPLVGHNGGITAIGYLLGGLALASRSRDDAALLWDLDLDSWKTQACAIANRDLTKQEWTIFLGDEPYRSPCETRRPSLSPTAAVIPGPAQPVIRLGRGPALILSKRWPNGENLHIRFLDGDSGVKDKVRKYASEWLEYTNLHFAFDDDPEARVRISFKDPFSSYSYIGTDALNVAPDEPTMALGVVASPVPENVRRRSVLHEFGHVLGLIHEHQKPDAQIAWDRVNTYRLAAQQYGFTAAMVDFTFFYRYSRVGLVGNFELDRESIMVWPIPKEFTLDHLGIDPNDDLSDGDKQAIHLFYPRDPSSSPSRP